MNKDELIQMRAEEALRILNSPMWISAWEDTRQAIFRAWESLPSDGRGQSDELHRSLKNLERVKKVMEEHIRTGKLANDAFNRKSGLAGVVQRLRG